MLISNETVIDNAHCLRVNKFFNANKIATEASYII